MNITDNAELIISSNNLEDPYIEQQLKQIKSDESKVKRFKELVEFYKNN
jgi:hypothetical protein